MKEFLEELKKKLEEFLGFPVDGWLLEEALRETEKCGAVIYWRSIQNKLGKI